MSIYLRNQLAGILADHRSVVVPEAIYRGAVAIKEEYDKLDGVEPGAPGCRWDLILWYLLSGEVQRDPAVVAGEIHRRVGC